MLLTEIRGLAEHSAAGAKGPGFKAPVAQTHPRFNSATAGKLCWLWAVRLQQTVIVYAYEV